MAQARDDKPATPAGGAPKRRATPRARKAAASEPAAAPAPRARRAAAAPPVEKSAPRPRRARRPKTTDAPMEHVPLISEPTTDLAIAHLSADEAAGRAAAALKRAPLQAIGAWAPSASRQDPIELLEGQEGSRVQWLLPLRHDRMAASPFAFYRGAAAVMASDLSTLPNSGLSAQLCGDAHLANFGVYGTPERRLVFDVNDFDETLPGPFEWDVKRLAASLVVAARDRGFKKKQQREAVLTAAQEYRVAMAGFATAPAIDVFYASVSAEDIVCAAASVAKRRKVASNADKQLAKARTRTSVDVFKRLTEVVDGRRRIKTMPPTLYDMDQIPEGTTLLRSNADAEYVLREYRKTLSQDRRRLLERYRLIDVALKVVGVGSVGTRCFIALMEGRDEGDPLFLQVKEATTSVLEPYLRKSRYKDHGQRVVEGQRLMQAASDILLGWLPGVSGRDFYFRQLRDWKGSADIERMTPEAMSFYAGLCGWTLARAHARSGDPLEIATYVGEGADFDEAILAFALDYADQNDADYAAFTDAIASGRLTAEKG